ncbi:MAG TPA: nuclear transport factor 2 family protein [Solirubrobacteraceae bacterium]|nr:nuclear transport factor 2 family protein [Solirubrobacteraceae bacterium]
MSQENVETVRRVNAFALALDLEAVIDLYHTDAEWRDLNHAPDTPGVVHGRAAIFALWSQWLETFDHFTVEIYEYIDAHPWVICPTRWYGAGKRSGLGVDLRAVDAYLVSDGKIMRADIGYPDVESALKAVGLEE